MPKSYELRERPEDRKTDQPQGRKTSKSSAKPTKMKRRPLLGSWRSPAYAVSLRMN